MGVLRNIPADSAGKKSVQRNMGSGVTVKCPKCQANIVVSKMSGHEPVRCGKCHYPMIRHEDLLSIVTACRKLNNPNQVDSAVQILRFMVEYMPEAGTALGDLAGRYTLPMNESDKWNCLNAAYAGGDENAREWLNLMCQTSPDKYQQRLCRNCGAPKYVIKNTQTQSLCIYCQQAD